MSPTVNDGTAVSASDSSATEQGSVPGESANSTPERTSNPRSNGQASDSTSELTNEQVLQLKAALLPQLEKDKKLAAKERLKLIAKLRLSIAKQQVEIGRLKKGHPDFEKVEKELAEVKEQNAKLLEESQKRKSRSKAMLLRVCKEQKNQVEQKTRDELWRTYKFISSADELDTATELVWKMMDLGNQSETMKNSWIATYKPYVKKSLNGQRNYFTSELKKVAWKCMDNGGVAALPNANVLLACAMRQATGVNEPKMVWYWTTVLPKVVGSSAWGTSVYYYTTILEAKTQHESPKPLVTVSHEAMICVVWENNFEKWKTLYTWAQQPENKGKHQPNMNGKYTVSDQGQQEWGGWVSEGLDKYNDYKKKIRSARKDPEYLATERRVLAQLRMDHGIDCPDYDTQTKKNRAKKRKLNADKPVDEVRVHKAVSTIDAEDMEEM
jgi:hypothetical protein